MFLFVGSTASAQVPAAPSGKTLPALRRALVTTIGEGESDDRPAPEPPAGVLEKVYYDAPLGQNVAYVTPVKPGARRPAIVWIQGGFHWGIDESPWQAAPRENDQSASVFRREGIAEMYPALRGENQNPGHRECFLGEVDDVLAAAEFLAARPDVDPERVYLGGHSTGAVIVLLAAASTDRFRSVFAFGPVGDARQYGADGCLPKNVSKQEWQPRAPVDFLREIVSPTFVIEGERGNANMFPLLKQEVGSAPIQFVLVPKADHFSVLAPGCELIAKRIKADGAKRAPIGITAPAIRALMRRR